ncbi:hypothetical protein [Desulfomarina sp.]
MELSKIPVPRSDTKLDIVRKHKENVEKKKDQIEKSAITPPEKIPATRPGKTTFPRRKPVFAPHSSLPERPDKHRTAHETPLDPKEKATSDTQPNPMDLIDWLLKKKKKQ